MSKTNLCQSCGIWSQCKRGFNRWLDQQHCRYAVKSDYRDQCRHVTEVGMCGHLEAQQEARNDCLGKTS